MNCHHNTQQADAGVTIVLGADFPARLNAVRRT